MGSESLFWSGQIGSIYWPLLIKAIAKIKNKNPTKSTLKPVKKILLSLADIFGTFNEIHKYLHQAMFTSALILCINEKLNVHKKTNFNIQP